MLSGSSEQAYSFRVLPTVKKQEKQCGREKVVLPEEQHLYIKEKVLKGWTPLMSYGR